MAVDIAIENLTNGSITDDGSGNTVWVGTGVFDTLISAINSNIKIQYDEGRLSGADYASVYLGSMQSAIAQSMQFILSEKAIEADVANKEKQLEILQKQLETEEFKVNELLPLQKAKMEEEIDLLQTQESEMLLNGASSRALQDERTKTQEHITDKAEQDALLASANAYIADATKDNKVSISDNELAVSTGTVPHKISISGHQATKAGYEADYVNSQREALEQQVIDNRKIKALDSLAQTYGTFGAGGLTLSSSMWSTYFNIAADLSGATVPSTTTVTKVS